MTSILYHRMEVTTFLVIFFSLPEHYLKDATPVFVGNLPTNIKRVKLVKLFKKYGKVLSIRFRTNKGKPYYKKSQLDKVPHVIAFVYLDSRAAAEASLERNGHTIGENVISVDLDSKDKTVVKPHNTVVIGNLKYGKLQSQSVWFKSKIDIFSKQN